MRSARSIPAFTLSEILVVLVISSIVVGFAFTVLDLVQRNLTAIRDNYETSTEIRHLEQQLMIDFNHYHDIKYSSVRKELTLRTPIDSLVYSQTKEGMIRKTDTLPLTIKGFQIFFEGLEVTQGKVDAVKIFLDQPENKFLFIYKKNSAKTFFE